ncbi:hypothetical protein AB0F46_26645 [Streptomyces sp. NPDC026665]|uniref:hypothetical protein n=1 Tax=Streptomyces sp. NPDC026665 TaxID=3154798 RepID=UPI0033E76BFA
MAQPTVLIVGDTSTPVALEDLTAFAFDVADRLGIPARVAVGMDYDVAGYEAVVLDDSYLDSAPSTVLWVEATKADVCILTSREIYRYDSNDWCGWCGEEGDAAPVLVGDTWTVSMHAVCAAMTVEASRKAAAVTV